MQKQEEKGLINQVNTFKIIYDNGLFIYSKKIIIFASILIFTSIGYFIYQNKKKNTITQFERTCEVTSNTIHNEIIISLLNSLNSMSSKERMSFLNLSLKEVTSFKDIKCIATPLTQVNSDLNTRSIIQIKTIFTNKLYINKFIKNMMNYLNNNDFVKEKFEKFNHLNNIKKQLLKSINIEIAKIDRNDFTLNNYLEHDNINTIDLFRFKLRLDTETLDEASINIVNPGTILTTSNIISIKDTILPYSILGFVMSIVFIYLYKIFQDFKNENVKKTVNYDSSSLRY